MADIRSMASTAGMFRVGTGPLAAVQPTMVRMQGVPTMPGYRDRPGKWNIVLRGPRKLKDLWEDLIRPKTGLTDTIGG